MSDEHIKPNKNSVDLGDFLILTYGDIVLAEIVKINEHDVVADVENNISFHCPYEKAVILKRDRTYLIGDKICCYSKQGIENE